MSKKRYNYRPQQTGPKQVQVRPDQLEFFTCQCGSQGLSPIMQMGYLSKGKASLLGLPSQDKHVPITIGFKCIKCEIVYPTKTLETLLSNPSTQITGECRQCKKQNVSIYYHEEWVCKDCLGTIAEEE